MRSHAIYCTLNVFIFVLSVTDGTMIIVYINIFWVPTFQLFLYIDVNYGNLCLRKLSVSNMSTVIRFACVIFMLGYGRGVVCLYYAMHIGFDYKSNFFLTHN